MLWEPSPEAIERSNMTRYMRWLEAERGLDFDDYAALRRWSVDSLEDFWASIWDYFDVLADGDPATVLAERRDARRGWFPRASAELRRARLPRPRRRRDRGSPRAEGGELGEITLGRAAPPGRRLRRRPARARGRARRPRRRLRAELPGRPDRLSRLRVDRRHLVVVLARLRRLDGRRPLRPDRAQGAARRRRLQLQRRASSTASTSSPSSSARCRASSTRSSSPTSTATPTPPGSPTGSAGATSRAPERRRRARVRARPLRPPALGPLLLGHHRPAEGDRPGPRRDPARAAEEAQPAPRRAGRRPRLLVHDDRLDDVELPRRRPAHRGLDRPLRRQPRPSGHGRALGSRRRGRGHLLRHLGQLHRRLHEGRRSSRATAATSRRCARSARPARRSRRRASSGSTTTSAPTPGCSRPRAAPTSAPRSSAACRSCPSTAASSRAARWAARSRPGTRTASR